MTFSFNLFFRKAFPLEKRAKLIIITSQPNTDNDVQEYPALHILRTLGVFN